MKKLNRAGKTFSTVVAGAVVIALFGTGTAVAGGLITSAKIKNNTVKSIDVRDNNLKGVDVTDGSLTGADLADGSVGGADVADDSLSGADVADGSLSNQDVGVLFATVRADGTIVASSGNVGVVHAAAGEYRVDFNRPVSNCAFSATVGDPSSAAPEHGEADVTAQLLISDNVRVYTRTAGSATMANQPFQVIAVC